MSLQSGVTPLDKPRIPILPSFLSLNPFEIASASPSPVHDIRRKHPQHRKSPPGSRNRLQHRKIAMSSTLKMDAIRTHRRRRCNSKHCPNRSLLRRDGRIIKWLGSERRWTDFVITSPHRIQLFGV
ncbi:hypothetical protein L2E82_02069 [Cichorium intybus]|uniref:Uncharacterized protein n=1 Tax=Cichorium intybus TaxID=13427 RepID=A0ACB9H0M7_CICIN|nr:hypothetical protein L2E82_02069 [Cichorium intybus]